MHPSVIEATGDYSEPKACRSHAFHIKIPIATKTKRIERSECAEMDPSTEIFFFRFYGVCVVRVSHHGALQRTAREPSRTGTHL